MATHPELARPAEIKEAKTSYLMALYGAKVVVQGLHEPLSSINSQDVVWELHDRIYAMNADEGDQVRAGLFNIIRKTQLDFSAGYVETMAILFQSLGEQESRW